MEILIIAGRFFFFFIASIILLPMIGFGFIALNFLLPFWQGLLEAVAE